MKILILTSVLLLSPIVIDKAPAHAETGVQYERVAQTEKIETTLPEPLSELETIYIASATQQPSTPIYGDCASWMDKAGITHVLARELIQRESGCNPLAVNPSSGACGIPQSLPCSKMGAVNQDGTSAVDPVSQLIWMQNYVMARYGSWDGAIAWHDANNWY